MSYDELFNALIDSQGRLDEASRARQEAVTSLHRADALLRCARQEHQALRKAMSIVERSHNVRHQA